MLTHSSTRYNFIILSARVESLVLVPTGCQCYHIFTVTVTTDHYLFIPGASVICNDHLSKYPAFGSVDNLPWLQSENLGGTLARYKFLIGLYYLIKFMDFWHLFVTSWSTIQPHGVWISFSLCVAPPLFLLSYKRFGFQSPIWVSFELFYFKKFCLIWIINVMKQQLPLQKKTALLKGGLQGPVNLWP